MKPTSVTFKNTIYLSITLLFLVISGCADKVKVGMDCFHAGDMACAKKNWQEADPKFDMAAKYDAAESIINNVVAIKAAQATKDRDTMVKSSNEIVTQDKWKKDQNWEFIKAGKLYGYISLAQAILEYDKKENSLLDKSAQLKKNGKWGEIVKGLNGYKTECEGKDTCITFSSKGAAFYKEATDQFAKRSAEAAANAKIKAQFDEKLKCGKNSFLSEELVVSLDCLNEALAIAEKNPKAVPDTTEVAYFMQAAAQAKSIKDEIEKEKKEAEEKARIEEERLRKEAEAKIRQAKAEEAKRLRIAEKARRIKEAKEARWRAFLKKGKPLTPLVATIGIPSVGKGTLKKKKTAKWQGGAQFPKSKLKNLRAEDIYSLEIVIPREYQLTYLRNYSKAKGNLLKMPQTLGPEKHYYTEGYKGGRFYTEAMNRKGGKNEYKIKGVIYKTPVTN